MKRLPGLDATFLHIETPSQFGHVSGLSIYARPATAGDDPHLAWRNQIEQRFHLLEPLPLVALVPVSIRTGEETDKWTNRVSMLITALPTDEKDPVERVHRVHDSMASSKDLFKALPAERLTDFAEFPPRCSPEPCG
jgi:hypothetical protein